MEKPKILLVEDDANLGFLLNEFLVEEDYHVVLASNGLEGLDFFRKEKFDLCILDVMMPKMDGFTLARKIRTENKTIPLLFVTAKSQTADKVEGFDIGCDDYITKPFEEKELLCRVRAILRRSGEGSKEKELATEFQIGAFHFNYARQELTINDQAKRLTQKEAQILQLLCANKNKILKRENAVTHVYGRHDYFLGRSFDVFISKIRKLLKEDPDVSIDNVFKVGFILNDKSMQSEKIAI